MFMCRRWSRRIVTTVSVELVYLTVDYGGVKMLRSQPVILLIPMDSLEGTVAMT